MKDLVEVIAKALVDHPDEVSVSEKENGRSLTVELHVAPSDMGKVIGKQRIRYLFSPPSLMSSLI